MNANAEKNTIATDDSQTLDEFDALVRDAARGDRRAIGALAVGYGPALLEEAREALGAQRAQEDEDVLQDLFVCMMQGKTEFVPSRDRAHEWLRGRLKTLALASQTDLVVARATDGQPEAVAQVMAALSDMLIEEARAVLGPALVHEAEDVLRELGESLLDGALSFGRGKTGRIGFLRRTVREMARWRRREIEAAVEGSVDD